MGESSGSLAQAEVGAAVAAGLPAVVVCGVAVAGAVGLRAGVVAVWAEAEKVAAVVARARREQ